MTIIEMGRGILIDSGITNASHLKTQKTSFKTAQVMNWRWWRFFKVIIKLSMFVSDFLHSFFHTDILLWLKTANSKLKGYCLE